MASSLDIINQSQPSFYLDRSTASNRICADGSDPAIDCPVTTTVYGTPGSLIIDIFCDDGTFLAAGEKDCPVTTTTLAVPGNAGSDMLHRDSELESVVPIIGLVLAAAGIVLTINKMRHRGSKQ